MKIKGRRSNHACVVACDTSLGNRRGVRYASQQASAKGRKYLQSQRLRRFIGEYPGCSTIYKALFMHRKTYNALIRRLRDSFCISP
jgi:hypothetical protein